MRIKVLIILLLFLATNTQENNETLSEKRSEILSRSQTIGRREVNKNFNDLLQESTQVQKKVTSSLRRSEKSKSPFVLISNYFNKEAGALDHLDSYIKEADPQTAEQLEDAMLYVELLQELEEDETYQKIAFLFEKKDLPSNLEIIQLIEKLEVNPQKVKELIGRKNFLFTKLVEILPTSPKRRRRQPLDIGRLEKEAEERHRKAIVIQQKLNALYEKLNELRILF